MEKDSNLLATTQVGITHALSQKVPQRREKGVKKYGLLAAAGGLHFMKTSISVATTSSSAVEMMKPTVRKLDIVLSSAANLKKMSTVTRTAAYAVAWIEPSVRVPSPMDRRHGCNPVWDATISIPLDERVLSQPQRLHIELLGQGLVSTKPIGFVSVDMTEIFLQGSEGAAVRAPFHEYPVRRRSGRQQGIINFELCLQAAAAPSSSKSQEAAAGSSSSSARSLPRLSQRENLSSREQGSHEFSRSESRRSRLRESEGPTSRHSEHDEISLLDSYDHVL